MWRAAWLATMVLMLVLASLARAEDGAQEEAKRIFIAAGAAFEAGQYENAAELYERAHALFPTPTAAYWHAKSLVELGKLVAAHERYRVAAEWSLGPDAPPAFTQAKEQASVEMAALDERIPRITLVADGSGEVRLDDVVVALGKPQRVDPGTHEVTTIEKGKRKILLRVAVNERDRVEVPIELGAPRKPPPPPVPDESSGDAQRIAGYTLVGLGGAGIILWAVSGALYLQKRSEVEDHCIETPEGSGEHICDMPEAVDAVDSGKLLGVLNAVGGIGGLACAGVGIVLLVLAPSARVEQAITVMPHGWGLSVGGRF